LQGRLAAVAVQARDRDDDADEGGGERRRSQAPAPSTARLCRIERPCCETDEDKADEGGEQPGRADLLPQNPNQPGNRGIDREGQQLPQRLHPRAGAGQIADQLWGKGQRQERQGQPEPECQDHGQRDRRRLGQGEADGRAHEWCRAGCCHNRGEHAGEERASEPRLPH
jgi:hypothetical protein